LSRGKAKVLVEEELNQRDVEFEDSYHEETKEENSVLKNHQISSTLKKNTKSNKLLKDESRGIMSPKSGNELQVHEPSAYSTKMNSKSQRVNKNNVSQQPSVANIKNYMNYSFEDEENPPAIKSVKKPNPTLAPIQKKPMNVPDLNSMNKSQNLEAMIPSVDELRKRRGDLVPLKHNAKLNNSFDSQE